MQIVVSIRDQVIGQFADRLRRLSDGQAKTVMRRVLRHEGGKARTKVVRALATQTGLKQDVIRRAVKVRMEADGLSYVMQVKGGNVRLKFFKARETAAGVSAAPWNARRVYPGTFMRAGWWPNRVVKANWNGQVFRRTGAVTKYGKDKFEGVRSGLFIPEELVQGATLAAWQAAFRNDVVRRVEHELARLLP